MRIKIIIVLLVIVNFSCTIFYNAFLESSIKTTNRQEPIFPGISTTPPTAAPTNNPSDTIEILYRCIISDPTSIHISSFFEIHNTGISNIDLSTVTIRYWFTADGTSDLSADVDSFILSPYEPDLKDKVTVTFHTCAYTGADHYYEIKFASDIGTLIPDQITGDLMIRIHKYDYSSFIQTDDYSFDNNKTSYAIHTKVTAYINDVLKFGTEPIL